MHERWLVDVRSARAVARPAAGGVGGAARFRRPLLPAAHPDVTNQRRGPEARGFRLRVCEAEGKEEDGAVSGGAPAAGTRRVPLALAAAIAEEARVGLAPACLRLAVAGSIRRGRPDVGDVELVAVPRMTPAQPDLFGTPAARPTSCTPWPRRCWPSASWPTAWTRMAAPRSARSSSGWCSAARPAELPLDLFAVTPPAQWGVILALRTGPGAFSTRLVTARRFGGGLPEGYRVREGALWDGERRVETPEEADLFAALGLPWLTPAQRTDTVRPVRRGGAWGWHDPAAGPGHPPPVSPARRPRSRAGRPGAGGRDRPPAVSDGSAGA